MNFESAPGGSAEDAARKAAEKDRVQREMEQRAAEAMRDPRDELNERRYDFASHEREASKDRDSAVQELLKRGLTMEDIATAKISYRWQEDLGENVYVGDVAGQHIEAWKERRAFDGKYIEHATVDGQPRQEEEAGQLRKMLHELAITQREMPEGMTAKSLLEWAKEHGKV